MRILEGEYRPGMKLADFHFHSELSPDSKYGMKPHEIVAQSVATGLSAIAITDHHQISLAEETKNYASRVNSDLEVIVGIEVDTDEGHVLGLFVKDPILEVKRPEEAIEEILKQGGIAVLPHPFLGRILGSKVVGVLEPTIERLMESYPISGFEVFSQGVSDVLNGRNERLNKTNQQSIEYYRAHSDKLGAPLATSDGHGFAPGKAVTAYSGDLLTALENKQTVALTLEDSEFNSMYKKAVELFGVDRVFPPNTRARKAFDMHYKDKIQLAK